MASRDDKVEKQDSGTDAAKEGKDFVSALKTALKKARVEKGFKRVSTFVMEFFKEWRGVEKEKEELSKKTDEEIEVELKREKDESDEAVGLDRSGVEGNEKEKTRKLANYDEVVGFYLANHLKLDEGRQELAKDGFDKLEKSQNLSPKETGTLLGGVVLPTLLDLREAADSESGDDSSQERFVNKLTDFKDVSKDTRFRLDSFLGSSILAAFRPQNQDDALALAEPFGISPDASDVGSELGSWIGLETEGGLAKKVERTMKNMGEPALDNGELVGEDDIVDVLKIEDADTYGVFRSTPDANIRQFVRILNKWQLSKIESIDLTEFAELFYLVTPDDWKNISEKLLQVD